jgi:hypothetical protein
MTKTFTTKRLSRHLYSREFGLWGERIVREHFGLSADLSLRSLVGRAYFVTITFSPEDLLPLKAANGHLRPGRGAYDVSYEFDQGTHFYNQLRQRLRGRGRQLHTPEPLMLLAADFDGSRNPIGPPDELHNVHLHALVVFAEADAERGARLLSSLAFLYRHKFATLVDGLDIRPFDFGRYSIADTVGYITKGDAILQGRNFGEPLIRVYPGSYRLTRVYTPISGAARGRRRFKRQVNKLAQAGDI